jgi:hypothetical protein
MRQCWTNCLRESPIRINRLKILRQTSPNWVYPLRGNLRSSPIVAETTVIVFEKLGFPMTRLRARPKSRDAVSGFYELRSRAQRTGLPPQFIRAVQHLRHEVHQFPLL